MSVDAALLGLAIGLGAADPPSATDPGKEDVEYWRDVRPILERHCLECHGPDEAKREAGLRLDIADEVLGDLGGGFYFVKPGEPEASFLLERIEAEDFDRMPPPEYGPRLSEAEVAVLVRWIETGAEWPAEAPPEPERETTHSPPRSQPVDPASHWSFQPLARPELPATEPAGDSTIDRLLGSPAREGASADEDPAPWRRLCFDLLGVPPEAAQASTPPLGADAHSSVRGPSLDALLAHPLHAERMAQWWIDAAAEFSAQNRPDPGALARLRDACLGSFRVDANFARVLAETLTPGAELHDALLAAFGPRDQGERAAREWWREFVVQRFLALPANVPLGDREAELRPAELPAGEHLVSWCMNHPSTARCAANRIFALLFDRGLADVHDLGPRSAPPVHPELLEWLAAELVDSGWDLDALLAVLVRSEAYRTGVVPGLEEEPGSRPTATQHSLDPWMRRDLENWLSGDHGEAGSFQRALLRDPQEWPAFGGALAETDDETRNARVAREFARRVLGETEGGTIRRMLHAFRLCTSREPTDEELLTLTRAFQVAFQRLIDDPVASEQVLGRVDEPVPEGVELGEWAAWATIARLLLALDATRVRG